MNSQEKYNKPFPSRLRSLIDERKTTITAIAPTLGISRQAVSQYCDGTGQPNAEKLRLICDYFDVSADYLLGRTDVKSIDADMQVAVEYTELSEKAIDNLLDIFHMDPRSSDDWQSTIIALLESDRLPILLDLLSEYISLLRMGIDPDDYQDSKFGFIRAEDAMLDPRGFKGYVLIGPNRQAKVLFSEEIIPALRDMLSKIAQQSKTDTDSEANKNGQHQERD